MKENRYARKARPRVRPALSPRVPVKLAHSAEGTGGLAVSGGRNQSPAVGQAGAGNGARRPAGNTMRNARNGGQGITYYDPAERARESLAYVSAHAPARESHRRIVPSQENKIRAAAEAEGFRQAAMQRHSILRTNGAVDIRVRPDDTPENAPAWLQTGQTGPVWPQETNEHDHKTYGQARDAF